MRLVARTKNPEGYALIEMLLAFGIAVMIIVAMVSLAVVSVRTAAINSAYAEAGKVAQSQAERLKLKRDTTVWSTFIGLMKQCSSGTPCYIDSGQTVNINESATSGIVTYYFTTTAEGDAPKEFTYTVVANWNISNTPKSYKIEGLLSDWSSL